MLTFLKLGGSLITDKHVPRTPRPETLARLMREIAAARRAQPGLRLVLGHGSGSFGHAEAVKYGTRHGVRDAAGWRGYAEVQAAAAQLNRLVVDAGREAGLPIVNFPPSASAVCRDGVLIAMAAEPIQAVVEHGLIPLVYGDVAVDEVRGGTIVSTEDEFIFLARRLPPQRILLAGIEPGVLTRWPDGEVLERVGREGTAAQVGRSHAADVTGGMASKVAQMLELVGQFPEMEVRIFSGEPPGQVEAVLLGQSQAGTRIGQPE